MELAKFHLVIAEMLSGPSLDGLSRKMRDFDGRGGIGAGSAFG
jgi:hypothetical protein